MYNIILLLKIPHIYLHGLYLIKPHQTPRIPTRPVSHYHCSLIPCLLLHVEPSGLVIRHILLPGLPCGVHFWIKTSLDVLSEDPA